MSKNMTRKGLAFGAGLSLVASGFAGLPAQADGLTGYITLKPNEGPATAFAVGKGSGYTFELLAQPASAIGSAGNLKFLITDPDGKIEPGTPDGDRLLDDGSAVEYPTVATIGDGTGETLSTLAVSADGSVAVTNVTNTLSIGDVVEFSAAVTTVSGKTLLATNTPYTVSASSGTTFSLAAGSASAVAYDFTAADNDTIEISASKAIIEDGTGTTSPFRDGDTVVIDADIIDVTDDVTYFSSGDTLEIAASSDGDTVNIETAPADTTTDGAEVLKNDVTFTLKTSVAEGAAADISVRQIRTTRSEGTYVIDSGVSNGSAISATFRSTDADAHTFTVQAWVDNFDNNVIDATEYVSEAQTVRFVDMSKVTYSTVLSNPEVGAETLVAKTTTTPVLNGAQMNSKDDIRVLFTRADSSTKLLDNGDATQDTLTGIWTSEIDLELAGNEGETVASDGTSSAAPWAGGLLTPDVTVAGDGATSTGSVSDNHIEALSINATTKTVTVTTEANHQLMDGDLITMTATGSGLTSAADASRPVTITGDKTFTYVLDTTGTVTAGSIAADAASTESYTVVTYTTGDTTNQYFKASRVFAGDYSATPYYSINNGTNWLAGASTASAKGTLAVTAADVILTTVGTADVQAIRENDGSNDSAVDLLLKSGTKSATVVATVVDEDGDAVGAGRSVSVTPSAATTGAGIKVAGEATATTLLTTDANGQVEIVITSTDAADGDVVDITVVAEGQSATTSILEVAWADAALQLIDMNVSGSKINVDTSVAGKETRYVAEGASYEMDVLVADQWYTVADSADYRLKVSGSGVTEGFLTLVAGKATVTITDTGVSTSFDTTLTLQKKSVAGVFADDADTSAVVVNTKTDDNPGILLGADGSTLYGQDGSEIADLSDAVAAKALVERDTRSSFVAQPVYTNSVVVTGKIVDDGTKTALGGAVVTVSGPSNILFVNGSVESRGSITFLASEADGEFDVTLYSTTAQIDSVITVTSMGVSETTKVTFTGIGVGEATSLVVTTPAAVKPASTFQVKAKLADVFGNGVDTAASPAVVKVTYTGAGIVFGTLPSETDANGELQFSVLLGSNDTGTISVTVSYDQNGDGDYVDAKDLTTTSTTEITASGVASSDAKVNAGSFKGYVALYAKGYKGKKMSAIVAGKWLVVESLASDFERVVRYTGAGYDIVTTIYIDGVKMETFNLTTK